MPLANVKWPLSDSVLKLLLAAGEAAWLLPRCPPQPAPAAASAGALERRATHALLCVFNELHHANYRQHQQQCE